MKEAQDWAFAHWGFCTFVVGMFIQIIPPIKWKPFTSLVGWIGKTLNKEIGKEIKAIKDKVNTIEEEQKEMKLQQMEDEKDRIRYEVLDFANSCRNKRKHTKDEFLHIIEQNDKYERLLKKTRDSNGVFTAEFEYIMQLYKKCQMDNDFLA